MNFEDLRFGLFIHFGLYSLLGKGEWVMNREAIPREEYAKLADEFNPTEFDADFICSLAKKAGIKYIVFTTMHHEGFRTYDSQLSSYNSVNSCGRDLTAEIVSAARKHKLKTGLYHSLNNWYDSPDAVEALEDEVQHKIFIDSTFARLRELMELFNPIDIMWYDGWWPFNAEGWQAERMNEMIRTIQPEIIFNGRNGLPGDFSTPEGHISAPTPWRPWEACMTLNNNWGFHAGDENWKSTQDIIQMLAQAASGNGNLLLNIAPDGTGKIPQRSIQLLEETGKWLSHHEECIFGTEVFDFDLQEKGDHRGDWCHHGPFTVSGNNLYLLAQSWPGKEFCISGLETEKVLNISVLNTDIDPVWDFSNNRLTISHLPSTSPLNPCSVIKIECDSPPRLYLCGGLRTPGVPHPHYDPCESDIVL